MPDAARCLSIARSLAMYYGIPFRSGRLTRFYSGFVTPGSLCFDIGSHAGNRVLCWRRLGARVIAVEPQPDFVRLLRLLYGRDGTVTILPAAIGRAPGRARLLVNERAPTVASRWDASTGWPSSVKRRFNRQNRSRDRDATGGSVPDQSSVRKGHTFLDSGRGFAKRHQAPSRLLAHPAHVTSQPAALLRRSQTTAGCLNRLCSNTKAKEARCVHS